MQNRVALIQCVVLGVHDFSYSVINFSSPTCPCSPGGFHLGCKSVVHLLLGILKYFVCRRCSFRYNVLEEFTFGGSVIGSINIDFCGARLWRSSAGNYRQAGDDQN